MFEVFQKDKSWITALVYGDGHIRPDRPELSIIHHVRNEDYLQLKADRLSKILGYEIKLLNKGSQPAKRISCSDPYFSNLRRWVYTENVKKPKSWLLNRMSYEDILYWYLDDGSLTSKKRQGKVHAWDLTISCCYEEESAKLLTSFFTERFEGTSFTLKKMKGSFSIRCGTKSAWIFLETLYPFLTVKSMEYKFRLLGKV